MNIEKKLQKRINAIVELSGEYPQYITVTEAEYRALEQNNLLIKGTYRNIKLIKS